MSSIEQFFNEVQAVATVLSEMVSHFDTDDGTYVTGEGDHDVIRTEEFTALWQAVELLSRAATYIHAQMQAEASKMALFLPEPVEQRRIETPKAARLFDVQGKPLTTNEGP